MKIKNFVMPAWIAAIQGSQDASGDLHVKPGFQLSMLE
jgi:hypothetical protein